MRAADEEQRNLGIQPRAGLYLLIEDVAMCGEVTQVIQNGVVSPDAKPFEGYPKCTLGATTCAVLSKHNAQS